MQKEIFVPDNLHVTRLYTLVVNVPIYKKTSRSGGNIFRLFICIWI